MSILRKIAPLIFADGLERCNRLGLDVIVSRPIEQFLDIGCGNGALTKTFASRAGAKTIYGIEIEPEMIALCESDGIRCSNVDLNDRWSFESDRFDLILSSQNIEHITNTRVYLEECYRCLKPGGQIIVMTENLSSWANIFALVFGWQPFSTTNMCGWSLGNPLIWHKNIPKTDQQKAVGMTPGSHVRVLAYGGLRDLLLKTGFRKVNVHSRAYLPFWGSISDLLCTIDRRHGHFLISTGFKENC